MSKLEEAFRVAVCGLYDENLLKFLKEEGNLRQKIGTQFFIVCMVSVFVWAEQW